MTKGDLTQGPVWKVILTFAFPLLVGNILQQFFNIIDSIIVGQFVGKEALAAVSASFFIYYFIISLVIGVGSGITVLVSQNFGAKNFDAIQKATSSFFIFLFFVGILLGVIGLVFAKEIFALTHTPPEVIPDAIRYFKIYIMGTVLFTSFNGIISVLRGMGNSKTPMLFIFFSIILNALLDLLFIIVFRWGIEGAALATVIAQGIAVVMAMCYIHRYHALISFNPTKMVFDKKLFCQGLQIGIPTGIQQCAIALGLVALLGVVNQFGADTLTAYGAAGKIEAIINQAILTLSSALAAYTGQNIGANKHRRVQQGLNFSMLVNLLLSTLTYLMVYFWGTELMTAFTSDKNVIEIGAEYLRIVGMFFV
ncbi:MAG: MATE family efflux transporter, partial [Tannerellaceae bacterium]